MSEAERASMAWMNMLGALPRKKGFFDGRTEDRKLPEPREYRWYTLEDGRQVFRPVPEQNEKRADIPSPQIAPDYAPYDCPITGKVVEGRAAHRENLKRHGCRVYEKGETREAVKEGPRRFQEAIERDVDRAVDEAAMEVL